MPSRHGRFGVQGWPPFFDFGNGAIRNYYALGLPVQLINDIFLSHLHVDHYADLPYLLPFSAFQGRYKPLRVHGPSGRTPELGTKAMIKGMKEMLRWHLEAFDVIPIGDGYEGSDQDGHDARALYEVLEKEVFPAYANRERWARMMQASIRMAEERFTSDRMVREYFDRLYPDEPVTS